MTQKEILLELKNFTNAWIAINNKKDQLHNKAIQINRELLQNKCHYKQPIKQT